jgi:light-harvesting complex 1 beta chain
MAGFADQEARQFHRIFMASFVVFLVVASIARLLPRGLRPWSSAGQARRSVIDEARAAANRFLPFAFMG